MTAPALVKRDRRARKRLLCSDPWRHVWCLVTIPEGAGYVAVINQTTGDLVAKLCDECARRPQARLDLS